VRGGDVLVSTCANNFFVTGFVGTVRRIDLSTGVVARSAVRHGAYSHTSEYTRGDPVGETID
jgi:hypothetical protein